MENKKFTLLDIENLEKLVGKTIFWQSPKSYENSEYSEFYQGIDRIEDINLKERHPIKSTSLKGDKLWFAFQCQGELCYSDGDRFIRFFVLDTNSPLYKISLKYEELNFVENDKFLYKKGKLSEEIKKEITDNYNVEIEEEEKENPLGSNFYTIIKLKK